MKRFWLIGLGGLLLAALGACTSVPASAPQHAQTQPTSTAPPAPGDARPEAPSAGAPPAQADELAESARRTVRSSAEWLARGVDSWFGNRPFSEGGDVTDGRLSLAWVTRQHETPDFSMRFNARFRLPNIEKRTYLFLGRDDQRDVVTDKPDAFSRQQRLLRENTADRSFFAGLGMRLRESVDFRLGLRGGLKPYAQARYWQLWQLGGADLVDFRETLFWTAGDQVGSTTVLSYEHAFSSTLAGRWLNAATITQRSKNFEWSSSLGVYKALGDQRLLSLEALFSGVQGSGVGVSDYGLQTKWEQPIHKDWLLGEILVGHFWPRADALSARGRAWALGTSVKMKF